MLANDLLKKDDRTFTPTSSPKAAQYFSILVLGKVTRCIGIFIADLLAKQVHIIFLLWLLKFLSSTFLLFWQKPFATGKSIRRSLYVRIAQLAFYNCLVEILWFYGITFCGPLRSILVFEQNPSILLTAILVLFRFTGSPAKTRGVVALLVGFLVLFFMDADSSAELNHAEAHRHQTGLNHLFYHVIGWFGLSDHKGGVVLLVLTIFLKMGYDSHFRHTAVEVGGPKRLYALVTIYSAAFLAIFALPVFFLTEVFIHSFMEFLVLLLVAAFFVMIIDFYIEQTCFQHVADPVMAAARWSPITMFVCSLILSWLWYGSDHPASFGVTITVLCFCFASFSLTSAKTRATRSGMYIGVSDTGNPLYTYGEAFLQKTSKSLLTFCSETIKEILANSDSRRIFWFLCANLMFCGVEFLYGFLTNSLGLISDGFHMLFDCSALVMGLVASVMSRKPATRQYSFGYGRIEVLAGFINALFLIVIAFFIFLEAIERLIDPPAVNTDKLLIVAVAGLLVNLFGMYAFHEGHGHSHGGGESHGHSHHGHSHGGGNANMQGVFLHVLADTLGSVFVIISTLLIQWFGWQWTDPLCSLILSMLIVGSVYPLLKSSGAILLQSIPMELQDESDHLLQDILALDGVKSYSEFHLWQLKSEVNIASICLQVVDMANEQVIRQAARQVFKKYGILQTAIQVEKAEFEARVLSTLPNYRPAPRIDRTSFIPKQNHSHSHGHSHSPHGHSHSPPHGHSHDHHDDHSACDSHGHSHGGHHPEKPHQTTIGIMNGAATTGHHLHHHH